MALMETADFEPLATETVEVLMASSGADVAVLLPNGKVEDEATLYRATGRGLRAPDFARLREAGVLTLLVDTERLGAPHAQLRERFLHLMLDDAVSPVAKAEIAHQVGRSIAHELVETPTAPESLETAERFVADLVECVLVDPAVGPHLAAMAAHHRSTASHMVIVSVLSLVLGADVYGDDREALHSLGLAALIHDLGKCAIHPDILGKSAPLEPHETAMIQQHPIESVRLIGDDEHVNPAARRIIIQHHERIDGRGYPLGLRGDEIDLGTRILTIVDAFHAITGPRPYRAALTTHGANRVLGALAGRQFDAELFERWKRLCDVHVEPTTSNDTQSGRCEPDGASDAHEQRILAAHRARDVWDRRRRSHCYGRLRAHCVYAGRLPATSAAPPRFDCVVQDVSTGGIGLGTDYPLFRGEILHLRADAGADAAWLEGMVAWCRRQHRGPCAYRCGVQLLRRLRSDEVGRRASVVGLAPFGGQIVST